MTTKDTPQDDASFDGEETLVDDPPTPLPEHKEACSEAELDIEDADTEIDVRRMVVGEVATTPVPSNEAIVEPRMLQSVQLSGEEAAQARAITDQERVRNPLAHVGTDRVDLPVPTNRECRMCGAKTTPPTLLRWSIPPSAGLRCDSCSNVFCRDHAVRVSSIFESLLSGARFRCQLCAADK